MSSSRETNAAAESGGFRAGGTKMEMWREWAVHGSGEQNAWQALCRCKGPEVERKHSYLRNDGMLVPLGEGE